LERKSPSEISTFFPDISNVLNISSLPEYLSGTPEPLGMIIFSTPHVP